MMSPDLPQEEQPWLVNSSTTTVGVGAACGRAKAGVANAPAMPTATIPRIAKRAVRIGGHLTGFAPIMPLTSP